MRVVKLQDSLRLARVVVKHFFVFVFTLVWKNGTESAYFFRGFERRLNAIFGKERSTSTICRIILGLLVAVAFFRCEITLHLRIYFGKNTRDSWYQKLLFVSKFLLLVHKKVYAIKLGKILRWYVTVDFVITVADDLISGFYPPTAVSSSVSVSCAKLHKIYHCYLFATCGVSNVQ